MGILHEHDWKAQSQSPSNRRVDTELALKPADHQVTDAQALKQRLQLCVVKRIRGSLVNQQIARAAFQIVCELPAWSVDLEHSAIRLVLDKDDRYASLACLSRNHVYAINDSRDIERCVLAST